MPRARTLAIAFLAGLGLGGGARAQQHRLDPTALKVGEVAVYELVQDDLASAAAAAVVTVHPPAGDGFEVQGGSLELEFTGLRVVRRDRFHLRALRPGTHRVKPAVLEGPDGATVSDQELSLEVRAPAGDGDHSLWMALAGGALLLPALAMLGRGSGRHEVPEAQEGVAAPVEPEDPLAACREARVRGDVRDFYVGLYAALRAGVRATSGRSPRDPKGLARTAEDAGLGGRHAGQLRDLATRAERVVFGGETAPLDEMAESFRRAEDVLAALAETRQRDEEEES